MNSSLATEAVDISLTTNPGMADSIILATAKAYNAEIITSDIYLKGIKRVKFIRK